jgi:hypothetical protein
VFDFRFEVLILCTFLSFFSSFPRISYFFEELEEKRFFLKGRRVFFG